MPSQTRVIKLSNIKLETNQHNPRVDFTLYYNKAILHKFWKRKVLYKMFYRYILHDYQISFSLHFSFILHCLIYFPDFQSAIYGTIMAHLDAEYQLLQPVLVQQNQSMEACREQIEVAQDRCKSCAGNKCQG